MSKDNRCSTIRDSHCSGFGPCVRWSAAVARVGISAGIPEPRAPNFAEILIRTSDGRYTEGLARRVREIAEQGDAASGHQPDCRCVGVVPVELFLGPSSAPVEVRVFGPGFADMNTLRRFADRVKTMVRETPGTWDVSDSWGIPGFQLHVDVDEDKANLAGVSNAQIAQTLNAYYSGHLLTTFREKDHLVPVYLRLRPDERGSLSGLRTAFVEGNSGKVPLNSIASIGPRWEPAKIVRRDLNRHDRSQLGSRTRCAWATIS